MDKLLRISRNAIVTLGLSATLLCFPSFSSQWGVFKGEVVTQWLPDGRKMRLMEDFAYVDPFGVLWLAPKRTVVDGASIPKPFWSIIGGPFEGPYRNASVIHDHYCESWKTHGRTWQSVHKAFYHAMLAMGVPEAKAIAMYIAVQKSGPRWSNKGEPVGGGLNIVGGSPYSGLFYEQIRAIKADNVEKSEVDRIERIAMDLASKGTSKSPEDIDQAFYNGESPPGLSLPIRSSPPEAPPVIR